MIKSIEDEFAGFELVKPAPIYDKPQDEFAGFDVVSRPIAQSAPASQAPEQDEFAGFELVQPAPAKRPIMSPYLRGVSEGTIKDEPAQDERRSDLLGFAPELALAMTTQVADFPLGLVRGLRDTTRSLLSLAIGEKNTENMEKAIYKIPILGKIWEEESKFVDKFGQINKDALALLRREAIERGGLPGAVAAELTQTVQNTLMFLKTVKALGVGYGGQQGIKSTLQSAAVRSAFAAITAEDLSPKERLAALGWSMAYQSTPALSSTIGKWAQSDWIAKAADIAANAGISGLQVQRVIGDAHARAEAEGKPNLGGFYSTLELIKMFGSDAVFGMMTTAFREQQSLPAQRATERLASEIKKAVQQYEQAKVQPPAAQVEDAGKPITPPPAPNQTPDKATTPLTKEGEAGALLPKEEVAAEPVKQPAPTDKESRTVAEPPAKTPAQPEGVTAKVEDLEYFAGMMTEIGEKIKSGEIQYGKTVFEDPDWMAKNYEFGSNGPQFSRNLGAAYPAGWNKKRTKQLETAIKHIKENTPLTNIDHEVIKHAQKAAYEGFGDTLEGPLENAKARGERNPEIVNEAELYNGDLVYRNGEWYKVKDIDGQKELADGATIRLDDFASVKAAVVIKPDHPDYKDAQQEYQSQLRAEKQAGGKAKKTLTQTEIPGAEDAFNLAGEDARQKMVDIETAGKERELAEAKARMDRQTPDMFGENTAAKPPTIKEIDDAVNVRARDNLMSEKGDYHVPGLRQADKITAGSMAYLVEKGEVTIDEWNTWISQARSENRFSDLDAPVRQPVPPSEKPEDIMAGIAKAFGAEQKPTEQSFNSLMDTLKKSRDADGKRMSEGEIRAALESDPSTGNKGRFKDMDATQQQAAMEIMQRMAGERGVGPGAASEDDPAFQPRMTIMKDGERVEPDTGVTGLRNSQIERERAAYGLAPAMDKIRISDPQAWWNAMRILNENPYRGIELTNELAANRRAVDKTELAILLRHKVEVNLEHNNAAAATLKAAASGDPAAIRDANLRHEQAVQMHQQIADVVSRLGTTTGQALAAFKMFSTEDFDLATMELKLKAAKGKDSISPEERAAIKDLTEKHKAALDKLTKRIAELEKQAKDKADTDNTKSEIEKTAREKSKRDREGGKEPDLEGDREKALNTIRDKTEKGDVESLADLQDPLQKLALYFEQKDIDANKGKSTLSYEKLVELVHNEIKTIIPEAAFNDVRDAISGYGQVRFPSAEPAKVALRRHKAEMLKAAPLETLQANIAKLKADGAAAAKELESTKHTGYQRDKIEARARELTRQLQSAMKEQDRMMKELGIETGDPAQRLRTALDAKKTRLQNQIDDINRAIAQHKELVRNKGVPVDDDITRQLTMMRDERMAAYKEMFPDKPMSMEERIERATKAAEKRLAEWEERAALARQGIFKTDDPIEQMPETERLSLLRRETEALKAEIKSWRDLAFPKATPEERRLKAWKTRTRKTIHEIERRIDQQDFSKRAKPEPVVLDQEGFAMKKAVDEVRSKWNSMIEKERLKNRTWTQKLWDRSTEPFNFARTVMASYDLSATGRQGWMLVLGHPKTAIGAFKAQINALRSEHKAYQIEQAIVNDKNYAKMLKAKVEFTEFSGKPSKMEESFMSRFASRIPGIQASQRAYTTFLNKMRADVFNTLYRSLAKAGEPTDAELLAIGRYINMATGRGDLGKHALASQSLATIFWAPRLFLSRFQLLAGAPLYHGSARTRKLIAGEYARFLGGMAMIYALAALSGAEIEEDPRSGQFGKIRYGNTRIDPLAGLAQATTLISRIATGETKTSKGEIVALRGEKKPFARSTVDYISQFLRSKLSPLIGAAVDLAAGENIVGEPVGPVSIVKRSVVPLAFQDIYDAMIDQGIPKGTAISMLAFLGFGVQTYDTEQSKKSDAAIDNKIRLKVLEEQRARLRRARQAKQPATP